MCNDSIYKPRYTLTVAENFTLDKAKFQSLFLGKYENKKIKDDNFLTFVLLLYYLVLLDISLILQT